MALIDERIQQSISHRFIGDLSARNNFFSPGSGTWESYTKIRLGYLLGIYSGETKASLKAMNTIRNRFAHRIDIRKFDHPDLNHHCDDVKLYTRLPEIRASQREADRLVKLILQDVELPARPTKRERFTASVKLLLAYLYDDAVEHIGADTVPKF